MKKLFTIILALSLTPVFAQETTSSNSLDSEGNKIISAAAMLKNAKLNLSDQQSNLELANKALVLSRKNNKPKVSAQAHAFLGELALDSNNIVKSMEHFLQASLIYRRLGDNRYHKADKVIDSLFPLAEQYSVTWPIANLLLGAADSDYKKKHYAESIVLYFHVLTYLPDEEEKTKAKRGQTYKKIAQAYKRLKNKEETALFYQKAFSEYSAIQDKQWMARTLNALAEAERKLGHYVTALDYSTQGLEIHKEINDPKGRAKAMAGAGIIYRNIERYEKSLEHIYQAHLYYKEVNDLDGMAETSNQMGLLYTRLAQFEQGRSFYQLTIDLPKNKIKAKRLAAALREVAVIDVKSGHYASAKKMATQAYKIYQKINDKEHQSVTARIIGNAYRQENNTAKAVTYYRKSLAIATEIDSAIYQIKALTPLASTLSEHNIEESIQLLNRALTLVDKVDSTVSRLYIYRQLRKAERKRGNYEASLNYAEKEIFYKDLIESQKEKNKLTRMKAKLYSHKKEMELVSLKEKSKVDQLELVKKNIEISLGEQERKISELELTKNEYANLALALLLLVSILSLFFIYRQFIASKQRNKELDYLAARDPLTSCYNRRILFENIEGYFDDSARAQDASIIMLDVDHFKSVNDKHGHLVGDDVLCGVASLLQESVRSNGVVARFGGEEFCIVLPNAPVNDALQLAEKIRHKIETTSFKGVTITSSFGVTSTQFNAKSVAEFINQADLALYESKSNGRNLVRIWNDTLERSY